MIVSLVAIISFITAQESKQNPHGNIRFECSVCHSTMDWSITADSLTFDHDKTGYKLIGAHRGITCRACHQKLIFSHIGIMCADCHQDIHKRELGIVCENCHSQLNWENRQEVYEQHNETRFPLLGVHANIDCESCHSNWEPNEFKTAPIECVGCHLSEYQSTENPNHEMAQFSTTCETCHAIYATIWTQITFQHPSSFTLRGAHRGVDCMLCHKSGYTGTPSLCEDCHIQDYNNAGDPNHSAFGFPTNCVLCHNEFAWQDATFDHVEVSGFQLRGAHATILCIACHENNQVSGLPRDCFGCHESDFNNVVDPNHVEAQYSHDCLECHSEISWLPSTFDHNQTAFSLTGSHMVVECNQCHQDGQYAGLPSDCFSCHEDEYNNTIDPNHLSAGFPLQCETCHTTINWDQTTWDHDSQYFPINSGAHREKWNDCTECHTSAADYKIFECILCHDHNQTDMDDKHKEVNNYTYQSSACYDCHPNGKSDD
jgi:hypothetical protein